MANSTILYVCFKFVCQQAVQIYYIPWPPKKLLPKIHTQTCLPKTAKICSARTANWPMLPKNELQKNILLELKAFKTDFKTQELEKLSECLILTMIAWQEDEDRKK